MGMHEESHHMIRKALIHELKIHKSDYLEIFRSKDYFIYIYHE